MALVRLCRLIIHLESRHRSGWPSLILLVYLLPFTGHLRGCKSKHSSHPRWQRWCASRSHRARPHLLCIQHRKAYRSYTQCPSSLFSLLSNHGSSQIRPSLRDSNKPALICSRSSCRWRNLSEVCCTIRYHISYGRSLNTHRWHSLDISGCI